MTTAVKVKHVHHWYLDRFDFGRCECGATKDFRKLQNKKHRISPEFREACRQGGLASRKKKMFWEA